MIYVYVIRSLLNGKRYVGISARLGSRLRAHAAKKTKGGQQLGEFELVFTETHSSYAEARILEKFLKSGQGRQWLDEQLGRATLGEQYRPRPAQ